MIIEAAAFIGIGIIFAAFLNEKWESSPTFSIFELSAVVLVWPLLLFGSLVIGVCQLFSRAFDAL